LYNRPMPTFSFDIVSTYDKSEMNNVFSQTQKEIDNRFDFKGTPAAIEWSGDKTGIKITGAGDWQIENILDILRKKLASRNQSSKSLDLTKDIVTANLKSTKEISFIAGLTQDKAKQITALLRDKAPKVKGLIQGDVVRVTSASKDELQNVMQLIQNEDFDFPVNFENYR
jgi:cyclic-di-GMP-binding protein